MGAVNVALVASALVPTTVAAFRLPLPLLVNDAFDAFCHSVELAVLTIRPGEAQPASNAAMLPCVASLRTGKGVIAKDQTWLGGKYQW